MINRMIGTLLFINIKYISITKLKKLKSSFWESTYNKIERERERESLYLQEKELDDVK